MSINAINVKTETALMVFDLIDILFNLTISEVFLENKIPFLIVRNLREVNAVTRINIAGTIGILGTEALIHSLVSQSTITAFHNVLVTISFAMVSINIARTTIVSDIDTLSFIHVVTKLTDIEGLASTSWGCCYCFGCQSYSTECSYSEINLHT